MKHCKNVLWCPCLLEGAEQFHSCFLEGAEQFHFCFLEGAEAEQFHGGTVPLLLLQISNFGFATELLILKLLCRIDTFKWPK